MAEKPPDPEQLFSCMLKEWHSKQECVCKTLWSPDKEKFQRMCILAEELKHTGLSDDLGTCAAGVLVQAGKKCNSLMFIDCSVQCFNLAIDLLKFMECNQERALVMSQALQCLIHTHVHNKDIEVAKAQLKEWREKLALCDLSFHQLVQRAMGKVHLEVGLEQVKNSLCSSAIETLEYSQEYFRNLTGYKGSETEARLLSALGYCLHLSGEARTCSVLEQARVVWKSLNWPLYELDTVVNTLKNYMECQLKAKMLSNEMSVWEELLKLHQVIMQMQGSMQVADVFTCLGMVAFHHDNEQRAVRYFEQACSLYKQNLTAEKNQDEVMKLLRFIGVASYNCREFGRAAQAYLECLHMLEAQHPLETSKHGQVAECCASLGFTYSRLRNFDSMLRFYERALELEQRLSSEDLELIITNIGSLYHVKAVKLENQGQSDLSQQFYVRAQEAFTKALRYSWKSFPFINYGYYLLCQGEHAQAASILQQGYLNGVIDKDTVEFDHTEDPILIEDLKFELQGREDIRMPSTIIALYLKTLAQVKMGNLVGAQHTAGQLDQEVLSCNYDMYYTAGYGLDRMRALCKSLLGYAFRAVGQQARATTAFQDAVLILPHYEAAKRNLSLQPRQESESGSSCKGRSSWKAKH